MATAESITKVQQIYIAFFGRPADVAGLTHWADLLDGNGGDVSAIMTEFAKSEEYLTNIGSGDSDSQVTALYQQMFGRTPAQDELDFWSGELTSGARTLTDISVAMAESAQGDDVTILANRVAVAEDFTTKVESTGAVFDGTANIADAKAIIATVDATAASVTAAQASNDTYMTSNQPSVPGQTFTLTTGTDVFDGTDADDTITGASGTVATGDIYQDTSDSDNDTANLVLNTDAQAPTLTKVETVNITSAKLAGADTTLDAANILGATITMNAGTVIDGAADVTNVGNNNVTAGTGITSLTVGGVTATGIIDAGSATSVAATSTAAGMTVKVNGDVNAALLGAFTKTLNATADSVVDLNSAAGTTATQDLTVTGASNVTLKNAEVLTGVKIVDSTTAGTLTAQIDAAGAVVATNWAVDSINVNADLGAAALTVKNGSAVTLSKTQTGLTLTGSAATVETTVTTGVNQTSLTLSTLKNTTIAATADITISTLATAGNNVSLTGANAIVISSSTGAGDINASAMTGALTLSSAAGANITGSTGVNKVTVGVATDTYGISTQSGADVITANALTTGTLLAATGAGDDTVKLTSLTTGTVTVDGGTGTDTIEVANAFTSAAATVTLSNIETIRVGNTTVGADTTAVTFDSSNLTGKTYAVTTNDSVDTVTMNVTVDGSTADLSGLVLTNIDTVAITGQAAAAETIKGTNAKDTITGNVTTSAQADVLTGGGADDTFVFATLTSGYSANDTLVASTITSITDFQAAAAAGDNDKLDIASTTVDVDIVAGDAIASGHTGVLVVVTKGILTLSGLSADTAKVDTLAEWIAVANLALDAKTGTQAEAVAFEFNGNTYVETTEAGGAIDNVIQLTGLTGVVEMGTTAAANTIVLA